MIIDTAKKYLSKFFSRRSPELVFVPLDTKGVYEDGSYESSHDLSYPDKRRLEEVVKKRKKAAKRKHGRMCRVRAKI